MKKIIIILVLIVLVISGCNEICIDKCGDGICQELVCQAIGCPCPETPESCPEDCLEQCAKEEEQFSTVYDRYPNHCCEGLTEWHSGMDTRISVADKCYETGLLKGSPVGTCINCGNGICEDIENPCNCLEDCLGQGKSTYNTVEEFCEKGYSSYCSEASSKLPLCQLCETPEEDILKVDIKQEENETELTVYVENSPNEVDAFGFDVKFEGEVKYLEYSRGDLVNDFDFFSTNELGNNTIRVGGFTTKGIIPKDASGNIVILKFEGQISSAEITKPVDDVADWI